MSRHHRRPFWQDNVLHVPTSPFMSPVGSPVPSPVHSPLVSPPRTPTHLQGEVSYSEESPDVANIILNALGDNSALTLDDILARFTTDNAPSGDEQEEEEEEITPVDDNIDESVQRAYHRFVADLRRAETAAQHLLHLSRDPSPPPAPSASAARPPPPSGTPPHRSPPPPPPRSRRRNAIFTRRPPPALRIPGARRDIVPLSSGGFTFSQAARSPIIISRTDTTRRLRRVRSRADLPLLRQYAAEATAASRERAHRRIVRFSRQLVRREDQQRRSPSNSLGLAGGVSSFQLTEDFGIPVDKCAICLENYRVGQNVSFVNCQPSSNSSKDHLFHTVCIDAWVASLRRSGSAERTCPVCRGVF